jgi:hypothetical protein
MMESMRAAANRSPLDVPVYAEARPYLKVRREGVRKVVRQTARRERRVTREALRAW